MYCLSFANFYTASIILNFIKVLTLVVQALPSVLLQLFEHLDHGHLHTHISVSVSRRPVCWDTWFLELLDQRLLWEEIMSWNTELSCSQMTCCSTYLFIYLFIPIFPLQFLGYRFCVSCKFTPDIPLRFSCYLSHASQKSHVPHRKGANVSFWSTYSLPLVCSTSISWPSAQPNGSPGVLIAGDTQRCLI